jgi:hypothetical protein
MQSTEALKEDRFLPQFQKVAEFAPMVLFVAGLVIYAVFLGTHIGAYAAGSDSSGYLNSARVFSQGRLTAVQRPWPGLPAAELTSYAYVPLGFGPASPGEMVPKYPMGMPLLVMATAALVGWDAAPQWVIVVHAIAGVLLMGWLGRCAGLSVGWATSGALLLATCPLYVMYSLQMMSDVPATAWAMATVAFAWNARRHAGWAFAAGCALGVAVLIRPTNVLLVLPMAIALGIGWRRWLGFAIGVAPLAAIQLGYNQAAYGQPFHNGYGDVGRLFQWKHVPLSLANYGRWLPILLTPVGLLAFLLPLYARKKPLWTALLTVWMVGFASVYAFYSYTHETWWYLRFILPAFPAAWIAALLVASDLTRRWELLPPGSCRAWLTGGVSAAALFAFACHWNGKLESTTIGRGERGYLETIEWLRPRVPASALVIAMQASGCLYYYTDLSCLRWDQIEPEQFSTIAAAAAGRPVFALLMPFEEQRAFPERLGGRWTRIGGNHSFSLWQFGSEQSQH